MSAQDPVTTGRRTGQERAPVPRQGMEAAIVPLWDGHWTRNGATSTPVPLMGITLSGRGTDHAANPATPGKELEHERAQILRHNMEA